MNESITRAAGGEFGQELPPTQMEEIIRSIGRVPLQRTTLYGPAPEAQRAAAFQPLNSNRLCSHPAVATPVAENKCKRSGIA